MTTGFVTGRALRPTHKVLPEHARGHNRSLVLQILYRAGIQSRADIARETGLTRVTVSDLVAELMREGFIVETGQREDSRPGKPATLLDLNRNAFHIVGIDLSAYGLFRGAVLDLDGRILHRAETLLAHDSAQDPTQDATQDATQDSTQDAVHDDAARAAANTAIVIGLIETLVTMATLPILGIGVGSPGVVDLAGVVLDAPNLSWHGENLQQALTRRFSLPVQVANDANVAALAEYSFGGADSNMMLIKVGHGVGAGLLLNGTPLFGSRFAAGEIGHVVVGTDGGPECVCGKFGCLETWLATPRLDKALAAASDSTEREKVLREAGQRLGIALAPVVGALNLAEVVLSGPTRLLDGALAEATTETLRARTMTEFHGDLVLRMTTLGEDIVIRGAAVMVLSAQLGVS